MTTLEQRLQDALHAGAAQTRPNPDLFARVQLSIEEDRLRRQRLRRRLIVIACLLGGLVASLEHPRSTKGAC